MKCTTLKIPRNLLFSILIVIWSLLAACDSSRELLNSERIERRFGNYSIELLESDAQLRISNLYSEQAGQRTCRTYAIVEFAQPVPAAVASLHAKIKTGQSIGSTLDKAGWEIQKRLKYIGELTLTDADSEIARLMRIAVPQSLAVHSYDFAISKDEQTINYASIVEIHHPEYLGAKQLREIYGDSDDKAYPAPALPVL